jgi:hypothetical protein
MSAYSCATTSRLGVTEHGLTVINNKRMMAYLWLAENKVKRL